MFGQVAEWLKATDCKSVLSRVRRFEPYSAHGTDNKSGSSSFGRAIAFQAIGGRFEPGLPLNAVNDKNEVNKMKSIDLSKTNEPGLLAVVAQG